VINLVFSCIPTYDNPPKDLGINTFGGSGINNYNTWLDYVGIDTTIRYLQGFTLIFASLKVFDFVRCQDEIRPTV